MTADDDGAGHPAGPSPVRSETAGSIDVSSARDYLEGMPSAPTKGVRRQRRGDASKTHILDCAIDLLGEHGYGGLSISAVCKAAGVAPTSIYWHFGDKAGLMAAMVKYSLRRDFDIFMVEFAKHRTCEALIDAYYRVFRRLIVNDHPSCWAVISMLAEGRREAPEIAALVNEARRKQIDFARGWGESVARASQPDVFADVVVGMNTFAANVWQQSRDEEEVERLLASMRVMMVSLAETMMMRIVSEEDFRDFMASWGHSPSGAPLRDPGEDREEGSDERRGAVDGDAARTSSEK